jgi:hypothetical protein
MVAVVPLTAALITVAGPFGAAVAATLTLIGLNFAWQLGIARLTAVRGFDRTYVGLYVVIGLVTAALFSLDKLVSPSLIVAVGLVSLSVVAIFFYARHVLAVSDLFPGLRALPWFRRVVEPERSR